MPEMVPLWKQVLRSPVLFLATGFGAGLAPLAPGTAGSLMGWLTYDAILRRLSLPLRGALVCAGFAAGVWACGRSARVLGRADPPQLAFDEVAAMWLVLCALDWFSRQRAGWHIQAAAFVLFRLFDMVKRGPVGWADRHVKGGFGIMLDDVVAAALTLAGLYAVLAVVSRI
ncbi:MAG: phosphatidylglycerophosphatase A [Gammaproteobacteria bacterium]|nr:phosphatidylglycerophosphatase A [Gammaproteobacteria bacterium]